MKKKIVGILVCALMITTAVLPVVGTTTNIIGEQSLSKTVENEEVTNENVYALHEPEIEWEYKYGGSNDEVLRDIKQTTDGGYITVGVWNSTSHWLVKLNASGKEQWNVTALPNETLWPRCWSVEQTKDGGYVTAGSHENAAQTLAYNRCIWKVDEDGNTEWLKIYDDPLMGYHMCIKQTTDGGYIVTGEIDYTTTNHDILLFKTDSTGEIEWQHIWNFGILDDCGWAVRQTSDGGYILLGKITLSTSADVILIKTDSGGNMVWNKTYVGKYYDGTQSTDILFASDGGYYLLGETSSFGFGAGSRDIWLIKTDANGNEVWNKTYGGKFWEMCGGICFSDDGNIMISGTTDATTIGSDGLIIKIDTSGNIIWQDTFGYEAVDQIQGGVNTSDGGYVAAGNSDTTDTSGYGGWDGWIIKIKNFENNAPDKPSKPSGNKKGECKTFYIYKTSTSDSDEDQLYYLWDWGDGNLSNWLGPYNSTDVCEANHSWEIKGEYSIKVKSKDSYERESEWSDPLSVNMPRIKSSNLLFMKLLERTKNIIKILRHLFGQ